MKFDDLGRFILVDCLDDWLMIGSVAQAAIVRGHGNSMQAVTGTLLKAIRNLLDQNLIRLGDISAEGEYIAWNGSNAENLSKLSSLSRPQTQIHGFLAPGST